MYRLNLHFYPQIYQYLFSVLALFFFILLQQKMPRITPATINNATNTITTIAHTGKLSLSLLLLLLIIL